MENKVYSSSPVWSLTINQFPTVLAVCKNNLENFHKRCNLEQNDKVSCHDEDSISIFLRRISEFGIICLFDKLMVRSLQGLHCVRVRVRVCVCVHVHCSNGQGHYMWMGCKSVGPLCYEAWRNQTVAPSNPAIYSLKTLQVDQPHGNSVSDAGIASVRKIRKTTNNITCVDWQWPCSAKKVCPILIRIISTSTRPYPSVSFEHVMISS